MLHYIRHQGTAGQGGRKRRAEGPTPCALSEFVVIENSEASGRLYEIPHVAKAAECVTAVLQEEGEGATWMFEDAYAKHRHWQRVTYKAKELPAAVEAAACIGLEQFVREFAAYQEANLPWLKKK